jgi:hypothetical protein
MATTIAKLILGSSYTSKIPHLEGEEVFGSTKQRQYLPLRSKGDSYKHDHVNLFRP